MLLHTAYDTMERGQWQVFDPIIVLICSFAALPSYLGYKASTVQAAVVKKDVVGLKAGRYGGRYKYLTSHSHSHLLILLPAQFMHKHAE